MTEAHPRRTDLVGTALERRYRVDALIARGGMSTVYRGLDTRLDRPVALKVMDGRYSGDRSFTERFENEARAAARLHHPNVVAVYDQGVDHELGDNEHVYLVMQLVEGATLRDVLREYGRLRPAQALSVIEPIVAALAAAHREGMVHRDIKPENVLIGRDGTVRVADFGLVRAAASAGTTSGSVILGTVAYLSPEQVTTGAADARSDVYAAGVVLYELLTGTPPYTGDTALSVAYRHVNDDVGAPSEHVEDVPPSLDTLVLRATRRDPAQRPGDGAAFLAELQRLREDHGLVAAPIPLPQTAAGSAAPSSAPDGESTDMSADGPSTDQLPAVSDSAAPAAPPPNGGPAGSVPGGPQGTRALQRPSWDTLGPPAREPAQADAERTEEMAAVGSGRDYDRHDDTTSGGGSRRRKTWWIAAVAALVIAALVTGGLWWATTERTVTVPKLAGKALPNAEQELRRLELESTVTRTHHNTVPADTVIDAAPSGGTEVRPGDEVELRVSIGRPTVPDIQPGIRVAEAERKLRNAKLSPQRDSSADRYHASIPEGRVIGVQPGPGTKLNTSGDVTIVVSKGPKPIAVPDLTGMSKQQAFAKLSALGLNPYVAGKEFAKSVATDHVVRTDPGAGTKVELSGTPKVGVVLSNAVSVPNLTGKRLSQANQIAAQLGIKLEVKSVLGRQNGRVLGQYPLPNGKIKKGGKITVTAW